MTISEFSIFLVDDDPAARAIAVFYLENIGARVTEFGDGASCLAALDAEVPPDIVILDVEMPDINGIEVCAQMRSAGARDTEVIFISAHDDLETRIRAYGAGGNDYLIKPFVPEDLQHKLEVARRAILTRRDAADQVCSARTAAFSAMSTISEMGVIVEFLRTSFTCDTPEAIGALLCEALTQYGLQGFVRLHDRRNDCWYASTSSCTALEASILDHLQGMERIFQFRNRLSINFSHVTLLIPDLPLDEPERTGRLRDHLAVLVEGAEARFLALASEKHRLAQARSVRTAAGSLSEMLEDIEQQRTEFRNRLLAVGYDQQVALSKTFLYLGLSETQEEALSAQAQKTIEQISLLQECDIAIGQRLREVAGRIKAATEEPKPA
jgi:CheY-like chemotaxis protein